MARLLCAHGDCLCGSRRDIRRKGRFCSQGGLQRQTSPGGQPVTAQENEFASLPTSLPRLANSFLAVMACICASCVRKRIEFASLPGFLSRGGWLKKSSFPVPTN